MKSSIKLVSISLLLMTSFASAAQQSAIMMENVDDPLRGMSSTSEAVRKMMGESGAAIPFRHCTQINTGSIEEEFEGRKKLLKEHKASATKTITLIDKCPLPASAQCVRNSGERTDFYYTESPRVLKSLEEGCEIKVDLPKRNQGGDISEKRKAAMENRMKKLQEMAQLAGGKWTTTVINEEMSDFLSTTPVKPVKTEAELAKESQERMQAGEDAMAQAFFGSRVKDKESILKLLNQEPGAYRILDDKFKKDKDIVLAAVTKNGRVLQLVDDSYKSDKEVVLTAIKNRPDAYKHADESLRNSKDFALEAIKTNPKTLRFIPEKFKKDKNIQAAINKVKQ